MTAQSVSSFHSRTRHGDKVITVHWGDTTPQQWQELALRAIVIRVKAAHKNHAEDMPDAIHVKADDFVIRPPGAKRPTKVAALAAKAADLSPEDRATLRASLDKLDA
jgi:hypothetical protein